MPLLEAAVATSRSCPSRWWACGRERAPRSGARARGAPARRRSRWTRRSRCRVLSNDGRLEQLPHHRRHAPDGRDALPLDELERPLGVPLVHDHELPAEADRPSMMAWQPVTWNSGTDKQDGLLGAPAASASTSGPPGSLVDRGLARRRVDGTERQCHHVGADVAVGAERALREPGRARRVEDRGLVFRLERDVGGRHVGRTPSPARPSNATSASVNGCCADRRSRPTAPMSRVRTQPLRALLVDDQDLGTRVLDRRTRAPVPSTMR